MEFKGKLVVAVSSRALFNLDESHHIFQTEGKESYCAYQVEHEEDILEPGFGYELVRKLLAINTLTANSEPLVEVILLSRNSADTGLRIFNSIDHFKLDITRAAFTSGMTPYGYIPAFGAHLFLSANAEDVRNALTAEYAAATILSGTKKQSDSEQLRIAFDGDAVLFSDHAERIYQEQGLAAFTENEKNAAKIPLPGGPFKGFLEALQCIQSQFDQHDSPIRTALVTARSAPAHERVVRTLRKWGIRIDEALFLGGMPKQEFLKAFGADIFFDDQKGHCEQAAQHISTAHVPHGITNQEKANPE
ncbi:5'-nucleotidase [Bathymodiolus platifrons methanotrophic gill symbiont]|uniref:5'-nucleotidase n=1 Tax=Bathymodiolus platifrons methanotrophic gill symbiont TaxID=113268 RepID=UPI000B40C7F1|nr:5'-nucleotidase [Bathymodiolus platifrons methanotrophic gill symbiont]MCK5870061.1 5'-nucleotidase [Methyloprofundus sp.]TXK97066.1 5'-nucleotidase [Methylococcaceae bacterium CS4]TXK99362.1 5'-nucleotidase [Methylococcaceae bacterium CS5]TXL05048.1 5'-nucleotidase [Methylococcaceae bacterium CS1]TXL05694.1 5'-nucleotidase [Methylococcaceae bacterium CS3]TXL09977.1 5'-nucleotidase [Methylococcaceae bacterium CS2]TXL14901.1 5'-nucleotidase [Methylococcaceae bacterium HT4]TXL16207.1 5'-nu